MNAALLDGIVKAILYEGYLLYPYRPSAVKNRQRFNFGVVYPPAYSEFQDAVDACSMQTECLALGGENTECSVRVRFLRMVERSVAKLPVPSGDLSAVSPVSFERVDRLEVNGQVFQSWQEAAEETIEIAPVNLNILRGKPLLRSFHLQAQEQTETITDVNASLVGIVTRRKEEVSGSIEVAVNETSSDGVHRLTINISNNTPMHMSGSIDREQALAQALVSAHTILELRDGELISLVDPPEKYRELARACRNVGTWPVLVGEEGERTTMLSSPIILYDYPQIAAESPGDLFDGAEIDEILSLRILTLTEDEKREMRESDERARQILERTEALPEEHWTKLHGTLRGLRGVKGAQP
jgi:hydrogenase maturation protease